MDGLEFLQDIIWIASGLCILWTCIMFIYTPVMIWFQETKVRTRVSVDAYLQIADIIEQAADEGRSVKIKVELGEPDDED